MGHDPSEKALHLSTIAVHSGKMPPSATDPLTPPVYLTNVFTFADMEAVDDVWEGRRGGYIYGRFGTPNHTMLEETVAALEGGEAALACASGMGAITAVLWATLQAGDHVVAARELYGTTYALLGADIRRLGVDVTFVDAADLDQVRRALSPKTRLLFVETISNPLMGVVDLEGLGALARERGLLLVVDNTFATPALCRALGLGAQVVLHSATKYLSGHGDVTAGIAVGRAALIARARAAMMRLGLNLSPFEAWLTGRGLRTLTIRMERHSQNALALARYLESRREVARVYYPGLESHPQYRLAKRQLPAGFGGMVGFDLAGGFPAVQRFMGALRLVKFAPSFGDVGTTWSYPARTSHRGLTPEERAGVGIGDGLVRLSVGIEAIEDLLDDIGGALDAIGRD